MPEPSREGGRKTHEGRGREVLEATSKRETKRKLGARTESELILLQEQEEDRGGRQGRKCEKDAPLPPRR